MQHPGKLPNPGIDGHASFELVFTRFQDLDTKVSVCTQRASFVQKLEIR